VAAINTANASPGADVISLASRCTYTFSTVDNNWFGPNALPAIASTIIIDGNGAVLDRAAGGGGAPPFRFFFVGADPANSNTLNYASPGPGDLTIRDVTIKHGLAEGGNGVGWGGGAAGMGGAIFSMGKIALQRVALMSNTAQGGEGGSRYAIPNGPVIPGGGGGIGEDGTTPSLAVYGSGGGFGGMVPSGIGASGGAGGAGVYGGGGAGFRTGEDGHTGSSSAAGAGGGVDAGIAGSGQAPAGDGGGGGSGAFEGTAVSPEVDSGSGGAFGRGGGGVAGANGGQGGGGGGGVGGGGGAGGTGPALAGAGDGGGGGFGGGGGGALGGLGGDGGFGGGAGGASVIQNAGVPGFAGGTTSPGLGVTGLGGGGAGLGGAIFELEGTLSVTSSTLVDNAALGGRPSSGAGRGLGGAIFDLNGHVAIASSTVVGNAADASGSSGRGLFVLGYDGAQVHAATATVVRSILTGSNGGSDVTVDVPKSVPESVPLARQLSNLASASVDVSDHDLVGMTAVVGRGAVSGSPLTSDPQLSPVASARGGLTPVMLPQTGSPLIDAGGTGCPVTDQLGQARPHGDACDIGAVESYAPANDNFANRQIIGGTDVTVSGDNAGATNEASEPGPAQGQPVASVWYSWTAASSGLVTFDTCNSDFTAAIAVYTGTSYSAPLAPVASTSNGCGATRLPFSAVADTTYQVAVGGAGADTEGRVSLHVVGAGSADTTAPNTLIDSGPSGPTNDAQPVFRFHATDTGSTFECSIDHGTAAYVACNDSYQPLPPLADGSYTFRVRATDGAGNTDASPATRSFTIDTTPPTATIDAGPAGPTSDAQPTFTFHSSEANSSFQCSLDRGTASFIPCDAGSYRPAANLADGSWTFRVKATDLAGNIGATATRAFVVDTSPPTVTIDSGPSGLTNNTQPTFTFHSGEADSTLQCSVDQGAAAFTPCNSGTFTSAALADGTWTFRVRATDALGNAEQNDATRTFTIDAHPPTVTIDSGPAGSTNDRRPTFVFHSSELGSHFRCSLQQGASRYSACGGGQYQPDADLAFGNWTFSVIAVDAAGNESQPATRDLTIEIPGADGQTKVVLVFVSVPTGDASTIEALLKAGGYDAIFNAPAAGTLSVTWYQAKPGAPGPTVVARGRATSRKRGRTKLRIKLTKTGRALLARSEHLKLTAKTVFAAKGKTPVKVVKPFTINR
jgi:hypothetical protein